MKMKWMIAGTLLSVTLTAGVALADAQPIKLIINGLKLSLQEASPKIIDSRTYVPLRVVSEKLGAQVNWDAKTRTIEVKSPEAKSTNLRIQQLEAALTPHTPKDAIKTYAEGVKTRNGALQYVALSPELKQESKKDFESSNWVTGVSSPWIDKYEILKEVKKDEKTYQYSIKYSLATSTGPYKDVTETYLVKKYDNAWYITSVGTDSGKVLPPQ
ncbi:copper amine oxidase N-terminal domain-containing protein [Brevibacillus dissolubilis]|uniref:copper amine oxidase N-terminal domain-containing protein n=1 Tax=Brevibacillus dissolubilis TaxID=1844116 RepID=UPI001117381A|nr:copper amine oxidase N-terminal domain-containing protein [Brevibacillus dissolubilis]